MNAHNINMTVKDASDHVQVVCSFCGTTDFSAPCPYENPAVQSEKVRAEVEIEAQKLEIEAKKNKTEIERNGIEKLKAQTWTLLGMVLYHIFLPSINLKKIVIALLISCQASLRSCFC